MAHVQRTPTKKTMDSEWQPGRLIRTRQEKKKDEEPEDTESDTSDLRRHKVPCCSSEKLNKTMKAFREEMKAMNHLLNSIKEEQDARFMTMQKDMAEIKKEMKSMKKSSEEVEKSIDYLSAQYDEVVKFNEDAVEYRKKEENRYNDLLQKNTYLVKCSKALEERIVYIEQRDLEKNIEIVNVKKQEGENIVEVVKKLAKQLNIKTDQFEKAWRVPTVKKEPAPIIVSLPSKDVRSEWLKARSAKITNNCIYKNKDNTRIYINEHLSRPLRQLFWEAKTKLKEHFKYIWIQDAKILIRKDDNERKIHQIRSEAEIDTYLTSRT